MTAPTKAARPEKPRGSPLFAAANGQWAKKINGVHHYFGPWEDHASALDRFYREYPDLKEGRRPRASRRSPSAYVTVEELVQSCLADKLALVESEDLDLSTFKEYLHTGRLITSTFTKHRSAADLHEDDWRKLRGELAGRYSARSMQKFLRYVRAIFEHGRNTYGITPEYGAGLQPPSRRRLQAERSARPNRLLTPSEVRLLAASATPPVRAMILLAINAGFNNHDVAALPMSLIDLEGGVIDYGRPKTGIRRRVILWPETTRAIRHVIAKRPKPKRKADADLLFITRYGHPWMRRDIVYAKDGETVKDVSRINTVTTEFNKARKGAGLERKGVSFTSLRHTFRTIAEEVGARNAILLLMGHGFAGMDDVYLHRIKEEKLREVTDHVRAWYLSGRPARHRKDEQSDQETEGAPEGQTCGK